MTVSQSCGMAVAKPRLEREAGMKFNQLRNKIGGAVLAFAVLFGIVIMSHATAQAQDRDDNYSQDRRNRDDRYRNRDDRDRNRDDRDRNRDDRNRRRDGDRDAR